MEKSISSTIVTPHGQFYRIETPGKPIYFAKTANGFAAAKQHGLPTEVGGFAVYDTTVSTTYAVALYATQAEADAHAPAAAPTPPESLFSEPATDPEPPAKKPFATFGKRAKRH